jgi:uncharacterized membrane protein YdjX (TVP38/TMEM64 family)
MFATSSGGGGPGDYFNRSIASTGAFDTDTESGNVKAVLSAAIFGAALLVGVLAPNIVDNIRQLDLVSLLQNLAERLEGLGPSGYVVFSLCYIVLEVLALPAVPLTASAGYLFGPVWGTTTVLISATIAAGISFYIGRTFLRKYVENLTADNKLFQAVDAAVGREGFKVVLLLRLSPLLPFALSNYAYGTTSVEFLPYLAATFLGFAPGTFA